MSLKYQCDGPDCGKILDRDDNRLELNSVEEITAPVEDDDGIVELTAHLRMVGECDHHFCSPACLASWAMARAVSEAVG